MKIGILGGTFDPIHYAHIHIAKAALSEVNLDKVIFMPSGNSYMKSNVSPSIHRLNMLKLALKEYPEFEISEIEINRQGYTYTCDTIKELKETTDDEYYFIIGTDTLLMLEKWYKPEYLFENLTFVVADRKSDERAAKEQEYKDKYNAKIIDLSCEYMDTSSTRIRECILSELYGVTNGENTEDNPDSNFEYLKNNICYDVFEYIKNNHLYKELNDAEMITLLSQELKESRLLHTLGVIDVATELAKIYNVDSKQASRSALLHDCAKYMPLEDMIAICKRNFIELNDIEKSSTALLHSKAGSCLAYEKYGITDEAILNAIKYHTTGRPNMTMLEKIIFVADFIEPNRTHSDKLPMYRMIAKADIDLVCMNILKDTLDYLETKKADGVEVDPMTLETYNFYKELIANRK
jgi:nicotinate-nucleotide adenylyltransferase